MHSEQLMVLQDLTASQPWHTQPQPSPHLYTLCRVERSLQKGKQEKRNPGMAGRSQRARAEWIAVLLY